MATLSLPQLIARARRGGFQGEEAAIAAAVAMAESGGNPLAHNPNAQTGDNSYGLWQVNMLGGMGPERRKEFGLRANEELFDPDVNARAAKQIRDSQGFGAWSVYKSGKYLDYLPQAKAALSETPVTVGAAAGAGPAPPPASQASSGDPLQEFTSRLLAGFTSQGPSRSQPELPALGSASPSIETEVRRRAIEGIVAGGFGGGQGGFSSGGFGASPEALAANNIAPLERSGSGMRMAGQKLDTNSFNPTDALPGLLAGLFAPRAARKQEVVGAGAAANQSTGSRGRVIEYLTGDKDHDRFDPSHGGSNYHEHLAFGSKAERDAAMQLLKGQGIQIGSVNDGKHAETSYHYSDQAFDVPASQVPVGQEQALSRRVREILRKNGFLGI